MKPPVQPISGHVYRYEGSRRPTWRAKYRLPDGRQQQRTIGPAWTQRGRPPAGYYTKRTAEDWLAETLGQARTGTLPGLVHTGITFADAGAEYMHWLRHDRERKHSTLRDYESVLRVHLLPAFGDRLIESITTDEIEEWRQALGVDPPMSSRTKLKILTILNGVMARAKRVHKLSFNPVAEVEKPEQRPSGDIDVLSLEEVMALTRAADSDQDAAIYLTAALTGLRRGELIALRFRDVDFIGEAIRVRSSYSEGALTTPKSGKVRALPMAPVVAKAIARQGTHTDDDALVFPGLNGDYLDGSALYRRFRKALVKAGLRPLRFHDLRHTFGTRMITKASILQVKAWMGHADVSTTMKYLHYAPLANEARLVAEAFDMADLPQMAPSP